MLLVIEYRWDVTVAKIVALNKLYIFLILQKCIQLDQIVNITKFRLKLFILLTKISKVKLKNIKVKNSF